MRHCPLKLERDPIIVHWLIDMNNPVENVIADTEEMAMAFKALASPAVSEIGAWSPGQCLQ